ncbi:hypothetical protein N7509_010283 [Penicillium cosmopolitanum]|uniref:Uncharacterized protein n=1 Tax=Penicillium cosmopolitanum TaxID=1131564 RepID=A0A9X0B4G1_9EURO|nr:uncharacterized protein N7509_010283 [Penicillium cosmopolitanum]KAJ5387742.1 hypothetical protein N7509_010283 [Penicillium cosmopolitanum]
MPPQAPFSQEALNRNTDLDPVTPLLPASSRNLQHALVIPANDISRFLQTDLLVPRLNQIHPYLWLAGRPVPPQPLNYLVATSREITADERIDMHMVWEQSGRIHLKPLPQYLLDHHFWDSHLICRGPCCVPGSDQAPPTVKECTRDLSRGGFGLLFSYIALVRYKSDFEIARAHHLLPEDIDWETWLKLVQNLLRTDATHPKNINPRYIYGELRLSRLNKIYAIRHLQVLRGYQFTRHTYGEIFHDYLTPLTAATIYVALVLTAMQVGLATTRLSSSPAFQNASFGFTAFAILGPLIGILLVVLIWGVQFTTNLIETCQFNRHRSVDVERSDL